MILKKLTLLLMFVFVSLWGISQGQNTNTKLKLETDTAIVDKLVKQASSYIYSKPDTAFLIIDNAISISKEKKLLRRLVKAYRVKGVLFIITSKLDSSIFVYQKALEIAEPNNFIDLVIRIYGNMGIAYTQKGDFENAERYYFKGIVEYGDVIDEITVATIYGNIGLMYNAKGEYYNAMDAQLKALAVWDKIGDTAAIGAGFLNIANIYFYQKDYGNAIDYYKKSVKINKKTKYSYRVGQGYHNLGTIYQKIDSLQLARFYLNKALENESGKTIKGQAMAFNMLGLVSMKEKKYDETEEYFKKTLQIYRKINSKSLIIPVLNNYADLYNRMQNADKSIKYSIEALSLAKQSGSREYQKDIYLNFSNSYDLLHKYKLAFDYYKKYSLLKDSLFDDGKYSQIQELEIKYKTAKKEQVLIEQEAEIEQNKANDLVKDALLKKRRIQQYATASVLVLVIIVFAILFYNLRLKRKSALLLIAKNDEISNRKISELIKKHQLNSVKDKLDAQRTERFRIAQELHDGIGGSLAAVKLYLDAIIKSHPIEELTTVHDNINKTYEEVRAISHNLTPPEFEITSIKDIVVDFVNQISQHSKIEIVLLADQKSDWNKLNEKLQVNIYRIVQELVNNVIKHAQASKVEIRLSIAEKKINIEVVDNGKGFDTKVKASGIGVRSMKSRVHNLGGEIDIKSVIDKGTEISLSIPIYQN